MHERLSDIGAGVDHGCGVAHCLHGGRVFGCIAVGDAVEQTVVEHAHFVEARHSVLLDARFDERVDVGEDTLHLGCRHGRLGQGAEVVEQASSAALVHLGEHVAPR